MQESPLSYAGRSSENYIYVTKDGGKSKKKGKEEILLAFNVETLCSDLQGFP